MTLSTKPIQLIDLAQRHHRVSKRAEESVLELLRSGQYIDAPVVAEAEQFVASTFARRGAVGVASGTDALILSLLATGVGPGDEVILPALSFFATAGAVISIGALPVIVDVREDGCIDPEAVRAAISIKTRAIIPVHIYGNYAKLPELGLPVIDDSAQAIGGQPPRSFGVLSALSTYPTKTLGAAGSGGFVLGDDEGLLERVHRLGRHGRCPLSGEHQRIGDAVGRNSRLDAIQAVLLLAHAEDLPRRIRRRRELSALYDTLLASHVSPLERHQGSPVHQYIILSSQREQIEAALAAKGIESRRYYPRPLHREPAIEGTFHCPTADYLCEHLLALPVHAGLANEDVSRVCETINASKVSCAS
jgi:dTDP-4-amino-4,6-dideoxygalactose transaminase